MATLDQTAAARGPKKPQLRTRKRSTRVDMTAMVDVAFLLLTFFVLTATLTRQQQIAMVVPPLSDHAHKDVPAHKVMTLILDSADVIRYYVGLPDEPPQETDFSQTGIRQVIQDHLMRGSQAGIPRCDTVYLTPCWDPIFVVKPHRTSRLKNLVDLLDEFAITGVSKYSLAPFDVADSLLLAARPLATR
ncbi:MAG: biopolymer transporter ExbD [Bacteroidia bacterium]|nr:biopolymer transporter ExbD [Bacteroidia bacterium]